MGFDDGLGLRCERRRIRGWLEQLEVMTWLFSEMGKAMEELGRGIWDVGQRVFEQAVDEFGVVELLESSRHQGV